MIRVLLISVFFSLGGIAYAERPSAPTAPSHASGNPAQHAVAPQAADLPCEAYYLEPRSKAFRMEKLKDAIKGLDDPDFSNQVAAISDVTCLLSEGERKNEALPAVDAVPLLIEALRQVGKKRGDFLSE
ncbi:MAG: hypothetical protein KDD39_15225, partial [Bdellovibrionales bacterium]|nr:hypothetical protein [Bdellovibrionales bacterium]